MKTQLAYKKICHSGSIKQNILEACELKKLDLLKEIHHDGGTKQNMPKAHELGKSDLYKKSTTMEV